MQALSDWATSDLRPARPPQPTRRSLWAGSVPARSWPGLLGLLGLFLLVLGLIGVAVRILTVGSP